jgi:light-regulated signal transduction histidine kinase (bacteriophytochrome)
MAKVAAQIRECDAEVIYDELPTVSGDWDRLQQLFEYLLDRALRQRGPDRPAIHISAEPDSGAWSFTVRDNGTEMDEESLQKAFVPFSRLHGNQRPGPGLVVCRAIVERHGGTMWAEACPGGCTFRFTLPQV